jgi:hypothetical protein
MIHSIGNDSKPLLPSQFTGGKAPAIAALAQVFKIAYRCMCGRPDESFPGAEHPNLSAKASQNQLI